MSKWENIGKSDEWYTPKYIFDALQTRFDMDVAAPVDRTHTNVPADHYITQDSLQADWSGLVWMNPPFGNRNGIRPWLNKISDHGNGIALTPDRTSAPWWQFAASHHKCTAILFIGGKVKFIKPDGSTGKQPSTGTTLFAFGDQAKKILIQAQKNMLGIVLIK